MAALLSSKDLGTVLEKTVAARSQWLYIGLKLGVEPSELEAIKANHSDVKDCYFETLKRWLKGVAPKPTTWVVLAEALESDTVGEVDVAEKVRGMICPVVDKTPDTRVHSGYLQRREEELKELIKTLQKFENEAKDAIIVEAVGKYASDCLKCGTRVDHVTDRVQRLCRADLLSERLYQPALQDAIDLHAKLQPALTEAAVASKPTTSKLQPLFNKDTVYHAGICSLAVCTRDAGNYQQFFEDKEMVPGHTLTGVSLSRSKQDRYLFARQGDSTVYLGFQSEPLLLEWSKQFKSFGEGIIAQIEKFPVHFIVDLLNKKHCIVLTGFSFGGLLAANLTACVWETMHDDAALLKQNLICITFGQPHVTVPMLESPAVQNSELASCIHSFYCEDDPVPRLLRVLDRSWSQEDTHEGGESHVVLPLDPFDDPITRKIFDDISKLQQMKPVDDDYFDILTKAISKLKRVLEKLDPSSSGAEKMASSTFYLIATHPRTGLTCCHLSQDQAAIQCGFLTCENLAEFPISFKQHSPQAYFQKLSDGFLDKETNYSAQEFAPSVVPNLKPIVTAVKLHHHGNQTSVAVEGEHFSFCYNVTIGPYSKALQAQETTTSSIQFNCPRSKTRTFTEGGKLTVSLESHFFETVTQEVQVDEKMYDISTRQQQLARLTPSELIKLALLCALLEQHPCGKSEPLSHKLEVIKSFLERVVHVVPLESVVFAMADGSNETAVMCSQACEVLHHDLVIPTSLLFERALGLAIQRFKTGVPRSVLRKMCMTVYERLSIALPPTSCLLCEADADTVSLSLVPTTPDGRHLNPLSVVRRKLDENELKCRDVISKTTTNFFMELAQKMNEEMENEETESSSSIICGLNIEHLYPVRSVSHDSQHFPALKSPLDTLIYGRKKLADLRKETALHQESKSLSPESASGQETRNKLMLECVNNIRKREVATCATLLGAFMEHENIIIGLSKDEHKLCTVHLGFTASASVGMRALFSLDYLQVKSILGKCKGEQLLDKIEHFVKATLSSTEVPDDSQYAAKLLFVVQGMIKTVTCNSQHVSYSLEQQLSEMCKKRDIASVDVLLTNWNTIFEDNVLSFVCEQYRPLIARWLIWALMIHDLRQELAKYTAIGVVGLGNSGKSELVNTIFGVKIPVGTAEASRTTVPFLYNLDEHVEGLNVVDFPGVDDADDTIPDLADLLVTVAQIVIFVVDYRRVGCQSAKQWLDKLKREKVPVLVCLTFADSFYTENILKYPTKAAMKVFLQAQLTEMRKKIDSSSSTHEVQFYSFSQENCSALNSPEGRQRLKEVSIGSPQDVGAWLVRVFREHFGQESLANQLESFIASPHIDF